MSSDRDHSHRGLGDPGTESGKFSNVSLMGDIVTFTKDHGPSAVIYTFSELMTPKSSSSKSMMM